jgi:hypothetical protein
MEVMRAWTPDLNNDFSRILWIPVVTGSFCTSVVQLGSRTSNISRSVDVCSLRAVERFVQGGSI